MIILALRPPPRRTSMLSTKLAVPLMELSESSVRKTTSWHISALSLSLFLSVRSVSFHFSAAKTLQPTAPPSPSQPWKRGHLQSTFMKSSSSPPPESRLQGQVYFRLEASIIGQFPPVIYFLLGCKRQNLLFCSEI